jgi:cell division septal protein FtsQ
MRAERVARPRPAVRISVAAALNLVLLLGLGALLVWFFVSDRFYVTQIAVEGNDRVSAEAIALASQVHGYSIFWVDGRQVAEAIKTALPPVRTVRVRYGLPDKVLLTVEEQGEQVMWLASGQRYWVDELGGFHSAQEGDSPSLIVRDLRPGVPTQVDPRALAAARQLVDEMPELTALEYLPAKGLQFQHERGWTVCLGISDDMSTRVSAFRTLEERFLQEGARQPVLIDVRFPKPYYRFAQE